VIGRIPVLLRDEITVTLDKQGRNPALRFDDDMNQTVRSVLSSAKLVERLMMTRPGQNAGDEGNPAIVLDGADASGEFLRLLPSRAYPFC